MPYKYRRDTMHRYLLSLLFVSVPLAALAADAGGSAAPSGAAAADRGPLHLSMRRAVELATSPEGNTYIQLSDESIKQSKARTAEARSAFLPDIEAQAGQSTVMKSLAALGLDLATDQTLLGAEDKLTGPFAPVERETLNGVISSIPRVIGPFTSVDVRARGTMDFFDWANIRRYQASKAALRATKEDRNNTGDVVSATVAKAYLNALRTHADVESYEASVALSQAILKQAENSKAAGTGTGLDVTRAKVQLAYDRQRLLGVQNERNKAHLLLLRAMGMNLTTELDLTDKLTFVPVDPVTVEQAETAAFKSRPDYQAQRERENAARLNASSVKAERLPNVVGFADYGTTGTNGAIQSLLPTRDYGFAVRIPVFDGGRRDARRAETASQFRQERTRTNDMREQMELDIRTSLDTLHSAEEQFKVAEEAQTLADSQLTQARRRYAAGVASNLEVTDAQTQLERARDSRINALFAYNVARIDLAKAMGNLSNVIQ